MRWLELPALKWFVPLPVLALLAWPVWRLFRGSWAELEEEALRSRKARPPGSIDWRSPLAAVMGFTVLALQYYHGTPDYFAAHVREPLTDAVARLTGSPARRSTRGGGASSPGSAGGASRAAGGTSWP